MSRIGKTKIELPDKVKVNEKDGLVTVEGPKGKLEYTLPEGITIAIDKQEVQLSRLDDSKQQKSYHGLARSLVSNMVEGVSAGIKKELEIIGVGYRVQKKGKGLEIQVGYSHPVIVEPPAGIEFDADPKANKITVTGIDKQQVGQVAANIRKIRPPEPYKGKGIRYVGEYVRRKAGKTAV